MDDGSPSALGSSPLNTSLPHKKLSFGSDVHSPDAETADSADGPSILATINTAPGNAKSLAEIGAVIRRGETAAVAHVESSATFPAENAVRVFLRVRPLTETERRSGGEPTLHPVGESTVRFDAPEGSNAHRNGERSGTLTFTRVFDETVGQDGIFRSVFQSVVHNAVDDGRSGLLFAYGMTNAGKTYTIAGPDDEPGLLPRTLAEVFRRLAAARPAVSDGVAVLPAMTVLVSYLEVYNEQVYDLLAAFAPGGAVATRAGAGGATFVREPLEIKDGRDGRVYVRNLRHVHVTTLQEALEAMKEGARNKIMAETALNADSSRSHTVFNISLYSASATAAGVAGRTHAAVDSKTGQALPGHKLHSRLSIVDLAGSERASRSKLEGGRLREAASINTSLMVLMKCFDVMRENAMRMTTASTSAALSVVNGAGVKRASAAAQSIAATSHNLHVVPFRESKLTRLFSDNLGGASSGSTVMIVNAGPCVPDFDETLSALKYGALAKEIRIVKNSAVPTGQAVAGYDDNGRRIAKRTTIEAPPVAGPADTAVAGLPPVVGSKRPVAPPARGAAAKAPKTSVASTASVAVASTRPQPSQRVSNKAASNDLAARQRAASAATTGAEGNETMALRDDNGDGRDFADGSSQTAESVIEQTIARVRSECTAEAAARIAAVENDAADKLDIAEAEKAAMLREVEALEREVAALEERLEDAEDRIASVEAEVRDEVAGEMALQLQEVEAEHRGRLKALEAKIEERIAKAVKLQALRSGRAVSDAHEQNPNDDAERDDDDYSSHQEASTGAGRPSSVSVADGHAGQQRHGTMSYGGLATAGRARSFAGRKGSSAVSSLGTASLGGGISRADACAMCDGNVRERLDELAAQVAECEAEIDRWRARYTADTARLADTVAARDAAAATATAAAEDACADADAARKVAAEAIAARDEALAATEVARAAVSAAASRAAALDALAAGIASERDALAMRTAQLRTLLDEREERMSQLEAELAARQAVGADATPEQQLREQLNKALNQVTGANARIAELENVAEARRSEARNVLQSLDMTERSIDSTSELRSTVASAVAERDAARATAAAATARATSAESRVTELDAAYRQLQAHMNERIAALEAAAASRKAAARSVLASLSSGRTNGSSAIDAAAAPPPVRVASTADADAEAPPAHPDARTSIIVMSVDESDADDSPVSTTSALVAPVVPPPKPQQQATGGRPRAPSAQTSASAARSAGVGPRNRRQPSKAAGTKRERLGDSADDEAAPASTATAHETSPGKRPRRAVHAAGTHSAQFLLQLPPQSGVAQMLAANAASSALSDDSTAATSSPARHATLQARLCQRLASPKGMTSPRRGANNVATAPVQTESAASATAQAPAAPQMRFTGGNYLAAARANAFAARTPIVQRLRSARAPCNQ